MGVAQNPHKVLLFFAVTWNQSFDINEIHTKLDQRFGNRDRTFGPIAFSWTEYYEKEMGNNLMKEYFTYSIPIERESLAEIKNYSNDLETGFARNGKRQVNIDPGYVARDKLVLASTKDFFHRIYIGDGIFAEVTLHYRKGRYRFFSWTYPDFRDGDFQKFLEIVRAPLVRDLRN
ncbi:MAG: DUF4416 family protein [Chitinispirillaceae bacterium]|nr:DUF4416 family protein [Chitinispirillaceae bacterium]